MVDNARKIVVAMDGSSNAKEAFKCTYCCLLLNDHFGQSFRFIVVFFFFYIFLQFVVYHKDYIKISLTS